MKDDAIEVRWRSSWRKVRFVWSDGASPFAFAMYEPGYDNRQASLLCDRNLMVLLGCSLPEGVLGVDIVLGREDVRLLDDWCGTGVEEYRAEMNAVSRFD